MKIFRPNGDSACPGAGCPPPACGRALATWPITRYHAILRRWRRQRGYGAGRGRSPPSTGHGGTGRAVRRPPAVPPRRGDGLRHVRRCWSRRWPGPRPASRSRRRGPGPGWRALRPGRAEQPVQVRL